MVQDESGFIETLDAELQTRQEGILLLDENEDNTTSKDVEDQTNYFSSQGSQSHITGDSILKLFDPEIMDIMDYLPVADLLNFSLASKRFSCLLKENPTRFPINLCLNFRNEEITEFERCYREVKVEGLYTPISEERRQNILKVFDNIGSNVLSIHFCDCALEWDLKLMSDILFRLPNLTSLQLEEITLSSCDCEWPALSSLKRVKLN